jgi:agmatinase
VIDPQKVPRFAGVATFMRMPHVYSLDDVTADAAFLGVPFDDATSYRPGARFGPRAIREASTLLKPYNPETGTNLEEFSIVDHDDVPVVPGYIDDTFEAIKDRVEHVLDHGVLPILAGGDHSTTLPVLRAISEKHGPVSLVQIDAHSDLWTEYFGRDHNHGTTVHYAIEEGLIDPETSIRVGDRGGLYGPGDVERFEASGIESYTTEEATMIGMTEIGEYIRETVEGPTFATIDIDSVDPAYAPGTGTPMPGGFTAREILRLTRKFHDLDLVGLDLVEVAPPYDDRSGSTAILAANVLFEALCAALE